MPDLLVVGGTVLDPASGRNGPADVLVRDGRIHFVGDGASARAKASKDAELLDAKRRLVVPGLIDMHVHLREPGKEGVETIASGAAAAVAGGFTSVACMPNTDPAIDSEADISFIRLQAQKANLANVFPVGAITRGRRGEELAEMGQMSRAGAVAFTDDGNAVPTAGLLRRAMLYASMLGMPILEHCENPSLAADGVMNEGFVSTVLGLPGSPAEAEEITLARDIAIAHLTGGHLHAQHLSTAGSVDLVRRAKEQGIRVTAEVTPQHLTLTEEAVRGYDPVFKVNPPLRTERDVAALREGLRGGVIDAVASDHAPHLWEEKELEFIYAPFGMIGLETSLGVLFTELVHTGEISFEQLLPALTVNPARILGLERGTLEAGSAADLTLIDPEREWTVEPERFFSRSENCPYRGKSLKGRAVITVVGGRVVYRAP